MKPKTRKCIVDVQLVVPFLSYENDKMDRKAQRDIERWVKETMRNDLSFIPLYVEKGENGSPIEDSTRKAICKVKSKLV